MSQQIRLCGSDWKYCTGECDGCPYSEFVMTDTTEVRDGD